MTALRAPHLTPDSRRSWQGITAGEAQTRAMWGGVQQGSRMWAEQAVLSRVRGTWHGEIKAGSRRHRARGTKLG